MTKPYPSAGSRWLLAATAALLACFATATLWQAGSTSATYDEPTHLAAGYTYWRFDDFRLNPEHPPLVKRLAALPLVAAAALPADFDLGGDAPAGGPGSITWREARRVWRLARENVDAQWLFAQVLLYGVRDETLVRLGAPQPYAVDPAVRLEPGDYLLDVDRLLYLARLPSIALGLVAVVLVFAWARDLFGAPAALLPLTLFAFDPNFIAHSALVTTDVAAATLLFGSVYFLWRRERVPSTRRRDGAAFVVSVAFAASAKFTALLLVPVLVPLLLLAGLSRGRAAARRRWRALGSVLLLGLTAAAAALATLWAVYGFRYHALDVDPPHPLPIETTLRRAAALDELYGEGAADPAPREVDARLPRVELDAVARAALTAERWRLVPESYLYGLARARVQSRGRASFLNGERSTRGFRDYFLWTLLYKTPLVALGVVAASLIVAGRRLPSFDLAFLLLPVAVYLTAAFASHLNIGHRHLLPIYPFLYVLAGSLVASSAGGSGRPRRLAASVAVVALGSSVVLAPPWRPGMVFPHYLAYFNELAGGPRSGYRHLVDSNLDWGQDLEALAAWLDARAVEDPIQLCYFGTADPRYHGIRHLKMPGGHPFTPPFAVSAAQFVPGSLLAISATHLQGVYFRPELREAWRRHLAGAELIDTVGHSIFLFRLEPGTP